MSSSQRPPGVFPYLQHTSLLGTHTLVLAFTAFFLPRSTLLVASLPPQQSSLDKPQHPFLVPITASPIWTLIWLCVGAAVCQAWWAGWMRQWWSLSEDDSVAGAVARGGEGKVKALRDAWANTFIASVLFHIIAVLFGAPITSHVPQTYLLSLLVSVLAVFVPAYALSLPLRWSILLAEPKVPGSASSYLIHFSRLDAPIERALVYPVLGVLLGAWTGTFPIPLDWDRPWQAWPLTPAYGAVLGYMIGAWLAVAINALLFLANVGRELQSPPENTAAPEKKRRKKKKAE